ncbi:MAG: class I SAM-dependent methyltransferase, partial [Pseudomonadales bacterium]
MRQGPTLEEQARFYDRWNEWYRADEVETVSEEIRCRAEEVLKYLDETGVSNAQILEIGCGTGWLTQRLNKFGQVTAVDLSPVAIQMAKNRDSKARYFAGDVLQSKFDVDSFDVIVCVETLFYVEDQEKLVELMARWMKSGGLLALTNINKFVY